MTKPKQSGKRRPKRNGSEPARLQSVSKAPKTATKKGELLTKSQVPRPYTVTPAVVRQRQLAPVKSGLYVKAPNGMQLRHRRVRRLVNKAQAVLPWLGPADLPTLRGWAELEILGASVFALLITDGVINDDGEPRALLREFRQLRQAQLPYERELGMTPASRAALGIDVARLKGIEAALGGDVATEDVEAVERRLLARLRASETESHAQQDAQQRAPKGKGTHGS